LAEDQNKKDWNLYVLRYHYSGNYYVGITENFERRMSEHWRQTSTNSELPIWSEKNKSTKGFQFYWFNINADGVSQSHADQCENCLARMLVDKIKDINKEKFIAEVHVGNGGFYDVDIPVKNYESIDETEAYISPNEIDKIIADYLKERKSLKTEEGDFSVKCCRIGYVGEYDHHQCNEGWNDVASFEF